ncbi:MAG: HNH endonuclease signature motif containing protein [Mycolicibacterium sp.]
MAGPDARLQELYGELAELAGQRNAIDGRIVEIAAEIEHGGFWGHTGARSVGALIAWKTGVSPGNARTIMAIAKRWEEFPICTAALRAGRLSMDQVGVIADRGGAGSDAHYALLAKSASVSQLRTAVKLEPRPEPEPTPEPEPEPEADAGGDCEAGGDRGGDTDPDCRSYEPDPELPKPIGSITRYCDAEFAYWRIKLSHPEAAKFEAALKSHRDALIAQWKRDQNIPEDADGHGAPGYRTDEEQLCRVPFPTTLDAFLSLIDAGWDADATRRPHGHQTTVVMHLDVQDRIAALHVGPVLTDADRRYLSCDATCEVWFERDGQPIGCGRTTRVINRHLRRALEYRHPACAVPGCGATRGLHGHHIRHWEDGGETELDNLVLVCPFHHRLHHRGVITISGPGHRITVTDSLGRELHGGSLARPPTTPPPKVGPYPGTSGERAQWWWYDPYQPPPPAKN